jgi:hypothetical protein
VGEWYILSISNCGFTYKPFTDSLLPVRDTLHLWFHWVRSWKVLERQLDIIRRRGRRRMGMMLEVPILWKDLCHTADKYYHSFLQSLNAIVNNRLKLNLILQKCCNDKTNISCPALANGVMTTNKYSTVHSIPVTHFPNRVRTLEIWKDLGGNSRYNMCLDQGTGKGGSQ